MGLEAAHISLKQLARLVHLDERLCDELKDAALVLSTHFRSQEVQNDGFVGVKSVGVPHISSRCKVALTC